MSLDTVSYNRSIYSILDFLGDVGGLYDGLSLIVRLILMLLPFTKFFFKEELLTRAEANNLIKIRKQGEDAEQESKAFCSVWIRRMTNFVQHFPGYFMSYWGIWRCCCRENTQRFKQL